MVEKAVNVLVVLEYVIKKKNLPQSKKKKRIRNFDCADLLIGSQGSWALVNQNLGIAGLVQERSISGARNIFYLPKAEEDLVLILGRWAQKTISLISFKASVLFLLSFLQHLLGHTAWINPSPFLGRTHSHLVKQTSLEPTLHDSILDAA